MPFWSGRLEDGIEAPVVGECQLRPAIPFVAPALVGAFKAQDAHATPLFIGHDDDVSTPEPGVEALLRKDAVQKAHQSTCSTR